jgi:hypothetical protein
MGMEASLPRLEALEELHARRLKYALTAEGLHDLVWFATGDKEAAEKAMRDQITSDLLAGKQPQ